MQRLKSDTFRGRARRLREEATRALMSLKQDMLIIAEQYETLADEVDRADKGRTEPR